VLALLRRHRTLCQRAVDPLEIAAALEAEGITDRTAARFRHRDVFSLAEELYARAPRPAESDGSEGPEGPEGDDAPRESGAPVPRWVRVPRAVLPLLPGALCAVALAAWAPGAGASRTTVAAACALISAATAGLALCRLGAAGLWALVPVGYAIWGEALLGAVLPGGPAPGAGSAAALGLALAVAPAAWCGRWFAVRARGRLADSRSLREFAAGARRLLAAALVRYAAGLAAALLVAALAAAPAPPSALSLAATAALGLLLFAAILLAAHGSARAAATGLAVAGSVELLALATASAAWLPGCEALGRPVTALAGTHGPAAVPLLACGAAALALLAHATRALARASAHQPHQPHESPSPPTPPHPANP
jgi:hypothetical protein